MVIGLLPELVNLTFLGVLDIPTGALPRFRLVTDRLAIRGAGIVSGAPPPDGVRVLSLAYVCTVGFVARLTYKKRSNGAPAIVGIGVRVLSKSEKVNSSNIPPGSVFVVTVIWKLRVVPGVNG
jgi:hypothetical protein